MEEKITYGVYWLSDWHLNEWSIFAGWFTKYNDAYANYKSAQNNPACHAAKIVERTEHFEDVTKLKR